MIQTLYLPSSTATMCPPLKGRLLSNFCRPRRLFLVGGGATAAALLCELMLLPPAVSAEMEEDKDTGNDEHEGSMVEALKSLFDPNEKTKSGRVLPKAYLKSARDVVKTLSESLEEETKDVSKFRRSADAAKESIREYLSGGWRGHKSLINEESNVLLEKAIRSLARFYSKAGPTAPVPEELKAEILGHLRKAQQYL
ncbi:photosystem II D1 precursor processing protein PSB27-H2, chloroplastic [Andrographis paniculata]|uniref:photosystem II D1 precursor processing protein PSB27-H2, chloroplastic n=1 Tax=Andrographis paniculata TaxID=175694 RepID=UPI0021E95B2E|nr:photosystem II D1 precursor processing protein PSB27-H2, chloroplastic [Andrographis paniculata]XP_051151996.1 photosystem II D1 precursor processing protein PSB27-H2, chloroplastic [Andrographis paniculata]XP_051151997.1 photosystem II D1 precursor processing protein PSB27-H2, chloroplastic [Andrographis paniculata]